MTLTRLLNGFLLWSGQAAAIAACLTVATRSVCTRTVSDMYVSDMVVSLRALQDTAPRSAYRSQFVQITREQVDDNRWRARATHVRLPGAHCTLESSGDRPECYRPRSWAEKHLTQENILHTSVEYWLVALTIRRRRRQRERQMVTDRDARCA